MTVFILIVLPFIQNSKGIESCSHSLYNDLDKVKNISTSSRSSDKWGLSYRCARKEGRRVRGKPAAKTISQQSHLPCKQAPHARKEQRAGDEI